MVSKQKKNVILVWIRRKVKQKIFKLYEVRFSVTLSHFKFIRSTLIFLASCAANFGDQSYIDIIIVFN